MDTFFLPGIIIRQAISDIPEQLGTSFKKQVMLAFI